MLKCLYENFEVVEKKINRITKKLEKNNIGYTYKKLEVTQERINIYNNYNIVVGNIIVDVQNYVFEMNELKIGEYKLIAILEHNDNSENMIYSIDNTNIDKKYRTIKSNCEHCKVNRKRNKTVLLENEVGNIIQVGKSCLNEYIGINTNDIIKGFESVKDIQLQNELRIYENNTNLKTKYIETIDYLANCIHLINKEGYNKFETKIDAFTQKLYNDNEKLKAIKVIEYFKNNDFDNDFLHNTKVVLSNEYSKINGFIAYSVLAYNKELDKNKTKVINVNLSNHFGNIKDKIKLTLTLKNIYKTEFIISSYTSTMSCIYVLEDEKGNIFTWKTNKFLWEMFGYEKAQEITNNYKEKDYNFVVNGTIKEHTLYKDIKQTALTRCKLELI
jgi:hypothetical protein